MIKENLDVYESRVLIRINRKTIRSHGGNTIQLVNNAMSRAVQPISFFKAAPLGIRVTPQYHAKWGDHSLLDLWSL